MRNHTITRPGWLVPFLAITVALMALALFAAMSFNGRAQAAPDADNDGMMTGATTVLGTADAHGFQSIAGLSGVMHKAAWKDFVVDVSLECQLYTDTLVKSKGGNKDTSVADAGVMVQVLVDGEVMEPGPVTFCRRSQTLSATFQGLLTDEDGNVCLTADPETGAITIDEDCLRPEELQLILDTTNANAFNFVMRDLPQGDYLIEVQAKISEGGSHQEGDHESRATIGKGSAIATEVRFAKTKS